MPLIDCPACGRKISAEAEACPQCGHPNRPAVPAAGPTCYACSAPATTKCQSCGKPSCVKHLQSIYAYHGEGGAYELRCRDCYEAAETWKIVMWVVLGGIALIFLLAFVARALGGGH
jgi:hypothetical protein